MVWGQGSHIAHVRRSGAPAHARGPTDPDAAPARRGIAAATAKPAQQQHHADGTQAMLLSSHTFESRDSGDSPESTTQNGAVNDNAHPRFMRQSAFRRDA